MKIENIKLSNILTFPYISYQNLEKVRWVNFYNNNKWAVNILIWPNWAWKSSFLETINQIFKVWIMKKYSYNKKNVEKDIKKTIKQKKTYVKNLEKNFFSEDKDSYAIITLKLNKNDFDNLWFLCKYTKTINEIIEKYSKLKIKFKHIKYNNLFKYSKIKIPILIDLNKNIMTIYKENRTDEEKFILSYIQNHELIQITMDIYNDFIRKSNNRKLYPLKNTFAILWSNRNFEDLIWNNSNISEISPKKRNILISWQNTKANYSISIWYYLCLIKLWEVMNDIEKNCLIFKNNNFGEIYEEIYKKELEKSDFFKWLNWFINEYLEYNLIIKFINWNFTFLLKWKYWHIYKLNQLSSWIQSFLMIIMTIYWYDLEDWLLIIDEPELHLHPQLQKKFVNFINKISTNLNLQVILATHSPSMINWKNIYNVYRFSKQNLKTIIKHPFKQISTIESDLIQMLNFENISKIFFVDKIILVEWDTDTYFFNFYIEYLKKTNKERKNKIIDYEILNIHWKWWYERWHKFLSKFWIKTYFIWDWDNIIDQKIIDYEEMQYYRNKTKKYYQFLKHTQKNIEQSKYWLLVEMIENYYPDNYDYIIDQIKNLYDKNIFILKKWDLETYIRNKTKWLHEVINFCENDFKTRLNNKKNIEIQNELKFIINNIFKN